MIRPRDIQIDATNQDNSLDIFQKRLAYTVYAIPDRENYPTIRSFWDFENILYGRVNLGYSSIIPNARKMVAVESDLYLMDFVADAYTDMKNEFKAAVEEGRLARDTPYISDFKAVKAYINPVVGYDKVYKKISNTMIRTITQRPDLDKKSLTFKEFYGVFRSLIKVAAKTHPCCVSDYMVSKKTYLPNTGISFEIADITNSEDEEKIKFMDSGCFDYYYKVAKKYGFYIDENAPWRLVANLSSAAMANYLSARNSTSSVSSYFIFYTFPAYTYDYRSLREMCVDIYQQIVLAKPSFLEVKLKGDGKYCKLRTRREKLDPAQIENFVPVSEWIDLYVTIKNIAKNNYFEKSTVDQIIKRALQVLETSSLENCLRYVDRYFNNYEGIEGSLNYTLQSQYIKNAKISLDNFVEYVKLTTQETNHRDY